MTSKPWMPWYVADFVGDTQHLDAAETGAYMLLLGHYWLNGGKLPQGDAALARVARMTAAQWKRSREALLKFFPEGHNKRADEELAHAAEVSSKRRASAKQKHSNSSANAPPNAEQMDTHARASSPSQPQKKDSEATASGADAPRDVRKDLFDRGLKSLAQMTGKTPDSCRSLVGKWLKSVQDEAIHVLGAIDEAERNRVADPVAWINKTLQPRTKNGQGQSVIAAADRLVENIAAFERGDDQELFGEVRGGARPAHVRLLPAK